MKSVAVFFLTAIIGLAATFAATAKPARCFTTEDGYYPCNFRSLDRDGSFEISSPAHMTYTLWVERPGFANGFVDFGSGRNTALPGVFVRQSDDRACWANYETVVRVCAW